MGFRVDRFATLYVVSPLLVRTFGSKSSIPILMYHSVSDEEETGVHPYYRTTTAPSVFELHMQYLYDQGYSTINLAEAVRLLQSGEPNTKRAVVTFDDGYSDFYKNAFPALHRHGFTATVFLPTAYIGAVPMQFKGKDCLTWTEIRELRKHNIVFGSHTVTHPQLLTLGENAVETEIVTSKKTIEDNLGESVDSFSYPYAFPEGNVSFTVNLRNTLVNSGYNQGVSTRIGLARQDEDRYFLRRLPMNSLDDSALFGAKLRGAYDWLHTFQYASKLLTIWC
jgi:peptidoglycan/xylan/chitin deacetylase (PgdA/CDA1 family)